MLVFLYFLLPMITSANEPAWRGPWKGIPELVGILSSVQEGREILKKAKEKNPNFTEQLRMSSASYTESTFVRTYSLVDGKEDFNFRHEVYLNQRLNLAEAVVDLAHELVHFSEKQMLDPYKKGFTLIEFVKRGIEGAGGELAALKEECRVAWALEEKYKSYPKHRLCAPYQKKDGSFSLSRALSDYYAIGEWFPDAPAELKSLPYLRQAKPVFTSSYAGKPYPVALAQEYEATKRAACENNRKKYRLIAAQAEGRSPASQMLIQKRQLQKYNREFCGAMP